MITLFGDRKHPVIRFMSKLTRKFPALKRYFHVSLWDGYKFQVYRNPQK